MSNLSFTTFAYATGGATAVCVTTSPLAESNPTMYAISSICSIASIWMTCKCTWREAWAAIGVSWIASMMGMCLLDPEIIFKGVLGLFFMSFIQACIAAYKTTRRTVEVAGEAMSWVVQRFVDIFTLKAEVKRKCPKALKMKIMEKKKDAVCVGIFHTATSSTPEQFLTIESTEGISPDIREGEVYMLND